MMARHRRRTAAQPSELESIHCSPDPSEWKDQIVLRLRDETSRSPFGPTETDEMWW